MKRLLVVFGTRPEAIKMVPLVLSLRESSNLELKNLRKWNRIERFI